MSHPTRIMLGAYQFMDTDPYEDHPESPAYGPGAVRAVFTSAMDEPFVNHYLTTILSREAQAKIVRHFLSSVVIDEDFLLLLNEAQKSGGEHILAAETLYAREPEDVRKRIMVHGQKVEDLAKALRRWFKKPIEEI